MAYFFEGGGTSPAEEREQQAYRTIKGAVFGHAVGDALGLPVEFTPRRKLALHPVTGMRPWGGKNGPKGVWSDDTSMTLCSLKSLAEQGCLDRKDMMERFCRWILNGEMTPFGKPIGIGRTTFRAVMNYLAGQPSGGTSVRDNGNGSLMRMAPIVLYQHFVQGDTVPPEEQLEEIHRVSALTHAHPRAMMGCGIYAVILRELLRRPCLASVSAGLALAAEYYRQEPESRFFAVLFAGNLDRMPEEDIPSGGHVAETLTAAIWALMTTGCYRSCVLQAVNLGGDADTIAAIAGSLAGVLYGFGDIPGEWIRALVRWEEMDDLCRRAARVWCFAERSEH